MRRGIGAIDRHDTIDLVMYHDSLFGPDLRLCGDTELSQGTRYVLCARGEGQGGLVGRGESACRLLRRGPDFFGDAGSCREGFCLDLDGVREEGGERHGVAFGKKAF